MHVDTINAKRVEAARISKFLCRSTHFYLRGRLAQLLADDADRFLRPANSPARSAAGNAPDLETAASATRVRILDVVDNAVSKQHESEDAFERRDHAAEDGV